LVVTTLLLLVAMLAPTPSAAQMIPGWDELPYYLKDRGPGIPTSMFGTYVEKRQLLVYPFYEYYNDKNLEYEPGDFGFIDTTEFRGTYTANEFLLYFGYGITNRLAIEIEAGVISAELTKSESDSSDLPRVTQESGLSDVEGQLRWRWNLEDADTPEFFNYFEVVTPTGEKNSLIGTSAWEFKLGLVTPTGEKNSLIGTSAWEFKLGFGLIKGFHWGTMTFRLSAEYSTGDNQIASGEYALEYLKRLSNRFRIFTMIEGSEDEVGLVPEIQWFFSRFAFLKAGTGIGLTSKATDVAPELGIMFHVQF
jgi:hypothetical protein